MNQEVAPTPPRPSPTALKAVAVVPFWEALRFWFKLGFISFGGPAGANRHHAPHLGGGKRWISERRFLHALNYRMLLPGPEAHYG